MASAIRENRRDSATDIAKSILLKRAMLKRFANWMPIEEIRQNSKLTNSFPWDDRKSWGVEDDAWHRITEKQMNPLLIFCHPRVLSEQPQLLVYYRRMNLLSRKGLSNLVGGSVANVEAGKCDRLDRDWLMKVVITLNSIASAVIKNSAEIEPGDLPGFQFAMAGATIQGSWNHAIASEGQAAIRTILVEHLRNEIYRLVWRDGSTATYDSLSHATVLERIDDLRVLRLNRGSHVVFGTKSDVSLRDRLDRPVVVVQVNAGADPAGALERLGAAMKSFENDRDLNPRVKTVYVVRCMTPELQNRINQGGFFDHTFALSDLLINETRQKAFANLFLRLILGKRKR